MRILITAALLVVLLTAAAPAAQRHERETERSRYGLTIDELLYGSPAAQSRYSPLVTPRHSNDRGGYRTFIPRGYTGEQQVYSSTGYRRATPMTSGQQFRRYRRSHDSRYDNRDHWRRGRPGAYTIYQYPSTGFYHGPGYSPYGAPTYVYPNGGGLVIDGSPLHAPAQSYYDNRSYDNSQGATNYYGPVQQTPAPAAPVPAPPVEIAPPLPAGPQLPEGPRAAAGRFMNVARIETAEGPWVLTFDAGSLYASLDGGSRVLVSDSADMDFGGFAWYIPEVGIVVVLRHGNDVVAAFPAEGGKWWLERLPYQSDPNVLPTIGMVSGEPWVTLTDRDGTRWVVALRGRQWVEIGSGTRAPR